MIRALFKLVFVGLAVLGVFLSAAGRVDAEEEQKPLRIAVSDDYPPFSIRGPGGKPFGLFVDMWELWSETTGIPVEFQISSWSDTLKSVKNGTVDIHSGLNRNRQREEFLDFSSPIHIGRSALHFNKDGAKPVPPEDMAGQKVGVVNDTYHEQFLNERYPNIITAPFAGSGEMISALLRGELRAVLSETVSIQSSLAKLGLGSILPRGEDTLFSTFVHAGVKKGRLGLLTKIDEGFQKISRMALTDIEARWLPDTYDHFYEHEHDRIRLTAEEEAWLQITPQIRLAVTTFIDPVDIVDDKGGYSGLNADLMALLGQRIGATIVPEFYSKWPDVVDNTLAGKVDGALSFSKTPERQKHVFYTKPYAYDPVVIVTRKGTTDITSRSDLKGKRVSAVKGLAWINGLKADVGDGELILVDEEGEALQQLAAGKVDAHVSALILFGNAQKKSFVPDLKVSGSRNTEGGSLRIAIHNSQPILFNIIEKALNSLTQEELGTLRDKWLKPRQAEPSAVLLTTKESQWLRDHPITRIAVLKDWPPYDQTDAKGQHFGLHSDLLRLINKHLGTNIVPLPFETWKNAYERASTAKVDGILGLSWTKAREDIFSFSTAYHYKPADVVMRKSDTPISLWEKLNGKKILVRAKASLIDKIKAELPKAKIVEASSEEDALARLSKGEGDAYLAWVSVKPEVLTKLGLVITAQIDDRQGEFTLGVHKSLPLVASIIQKGINSITQEEWADLRQRWLDPMAAGRVALSREQKAWLKAHPIIDIGMMDAWPPLSYTDNRGQPQGLSVALVETLNKKLGGVLRLKPAPFKQNLDAVKNKKLAALLDITPKPDREPFFNFTDEYLSIPHVYVAKENAPFISGEENLTGKILALEKGFGNVKWFAANHPNIQIKEYADTSLALDAVSRGEADAYAGNRAIAQHIIKQELIHNLKLHGRMGRAPTALAIGTRKDWPILRDILQKGLASITEAERSAILQSVMPSTGQKARVQINLSDQEREWLRKHPTIRVHNETAWPPFNFNERGQPKGYSIEYMDLLAQKIGVEVNYITGPSWGEFMDMIKGKSLDVMLNIVKTQEREKYVLFTEPYINNPPVVITLSSSTLGNFAELTGSLVCVPKGFFYQEILERKYPNIPLVLSKNQVECLKMVSSGQASATIGGLAVQDYLIKKLFLSNLKIAAHVNDDAFSNKLRLGVRDDWPVLQSILEKAIAAVTEDELQPIRNRWMASTNADQITSAPQTDTLTLVMIIGGVAVGLIVLLAVVREVISRMAARDMSKAYESREIKGTGMLAVGIFLAIVILAAWVSASNTEQHTRTRIGETLQTVLNTTHEALITWVKSESLIIEDIARDPGLRTRVDALLKVPRDPESLKKSTEIADLRKWFVERFSAVDVQGFFIISPDMISVGSRRDANIGTLNLIAKQRRERLTKVFAGQTQFIPPIVSDVVLKGDGSGQTINEPTMFFATPIKNFDGQVIAVLTIRQDPSKDFTRIVQLGHVGASGETYAIDKVGHLVTESRFDGDLRQYGLIADDAKGILNLDVRDPGGDLTKGYALPEEMASQPLTRMAASVTTGEQGMDMVGYADYRGVRVMGTWLWNEALGIGLATEIDEDEAMSAFRNIRQTMMIVLGITILTALGLTGLSVWIGQSANKSLIKARDNLEGLVEERTAELAVSEERTRLLLESVGEGVFGVDLEGQVVFLNPTAVKLLGYEPEELMGKKIHAIVHHTYPDGQEYPVENCPMYKTYTEGESHTVDNEVLWRKDGTSFEVEYHSMPVIKDGELAGAVISFADISERKEAEEKLKGAYSIISDSIDYASNIQRSVLTGEDMMAATMSEHLVLWEPRDVVGGDIYWCHLWGDGILIVLADCTGHGVPGAFMTLISTGALDRAMTEIPPGKVGDLIQRMHQIIQITLNQHGGRGESDDGLELGACFMGPDMDKMTYAGARFPLFMLNKGDVTEFKGAKKGIGYRGVSQTQIFEETEIALEPGMSFYMSTDGFLDQVGGERRRMYGKKRFKDLLLSMEDLPFAEQKKTIYRTLLDYQGKELRRDDVAIIGFKV